MIKREKLLILGCSVGTEDALQYAKELGVYTIITDNIIPGENSLKRMADEYWMIDVADVDALESRCKEEEVSGIFAATSEFCLDKAKELCERLKLPFYASDEGWASARDKERFKRHCADCGINVPKKYEVCGPISEELLKEISWPVIVKPADSYAQIGLSVCHNTEELRKGYEFALQKARIGKVVAEEYIEGDAVAAVYLLKDGQIKYIGIVDFVYMPINGRSNYITCTVHNSIFSEEYAEKCSDKVERLLRTLECQNGTVFFQAIRKNGVYYFLEMGYRLNGGGSWIIDEKLIGVNIIKYMVDFALQHETKQWPDKEKTDSVYRAGGSYLIWTRLGRVGRVEGVKKVEEMEGVRIILQNFHAGDFVPEDVSMKQIAFYICLVAEDKEKMKRKIQDINKTLHLYDSEGNEMLLYFREYEKL